MNLVWQARSNPLGWWWALLTLVSSGNIALWYLLYREFHSQPTGGLDSTSDIDFMLLLCEAYVFGCAFRSLLPRADIQRICLFDTWLSSVLVGRSVATVAEICFAMQWAMILRQLGGIVGGLLRPLVAWDKAEIVREAQEIGTYAVSALPAEDCCTLFTPKHPATRAKPHEVERAEADLPIEEIVAQAVAAAEIEHFRFPDRPDIK